MKKIYKKSELESLTLKQLNNILIEEQCGRIVETFTSIALMNTFRLIPYETFVKKILEYGGGVTNPTHYYMTYDQDLIFFNSEIEARIFALPLVEDELKLAKRLED